MKAKYEASDIEVLKGLEPVRKRPGMYTDTSRPDHLAQEVIDNSVDEAISGFAKTLEVSLYRDGSLEVVDDGRGMPVDVHRGEKVPGVELILTRLHAGAKFSNKSYRFSGGLHGVGVSVVNALSKRLEVWIRRDGNEYHMAFADGKKVSNLKAVGKAGKRNTGHDHPLLAQRQVFRQRQIHPGAAQAPAALQGRVVPRTQGPPVRRGRRRAAWSGTTRTGSRDIWRTPWARRRCSRRGAVHRAHDRQ